MIRYGSVCSGIEAATAAWHGLGWKPSFFSEIEAFPCAVLKHHYPDVPLHGDFTTIKGDEYEPIDLLVGGTPCQSFSIAGLRGGLDDDRGNLALEFLRLAQREQPRWIVWENVPGVLSSSGGRDFGSIIGGMVEIGYGIAYRVLDAQYFGVAQRRRRVFVVGCLGDAASAAAVLFERHSLQGHPAPSREKREGSPGYTASSFGKYSEGVGTIRAAGGDLGGGSETLHVTAHRMLSMGEYRQDEVASAMKARDYKDATDLVAFDTYNQTTSDVSQPIRAAASDVDKMGAVLTQSVVRRLTPRECERLQGFPDDFTQIPYRNKPAENCPDGPRYKALGNSMAVPVMRWIGERIQIVESINRDRDMQ